MGNKFKSINIINVYEVNGLKEPKLPAETREITIREHWNDSELVNIIIEELTITVCANDLERAIKNARNAHNQF